MPTSTPRSRNAASARAIHAEAYTRSLSNSCGHTASLSHDASPQRPISSATDVEGPTSTSERPSCSSGSRHGHTASKSTVCAAAIPPLAAAVANAALTAVTSSPVRSACHAINMSPPLVSVAG